AVNPVVQPAVHTAAPTRTTVHQGNAIASTAALQPQQVQTRDEIPIAPAATSARNRPRFRALALFGRRPQQRVDRPSSRQPKTCTRHKSGPRPLLDTDVDSPVAPQENSTSHCGFRRGTPEPHMLFHSKIIVG